MMFDTKILFLVIIVIGGLGAINQVVPDVGRVMGIEFMTFFVGLFGMLVIMRYRGFIDGHIAGYKKAIKDMQDPFMFHPSGGLVQ